MGIGYLTLRGSRRIAFAPGSWLTNLCRRERASSSFSVLFRWFDYQCGPRFAESRRDSVTQPRVARNELPWVSKFIEFVFNPKPGLCLP